ncbi:GNAT family N-acetyltransferase [Nicoliella spurrieriana]|uniref:GNAT family N-acetyltransferase n=1 Tax=Nicoliella spurrieriana TaxID=2925830 RepID=A0A976RSC0_9LACO|nr:GNAT family N-acetyltransferase [Nicoliella spurrieriana]UQS86874.1 GNAT family N-acetyltransferase [Nicoliella spurrieriana]
MDQITFRNAQMNDLNALMQIERTGFSPAEAASEIAMRERIAKLSDTFIVAINAGQLVGFVVGAAYDRRYLDDALYEKSTPNQPTDHYQTVLSIAVLPSERGHGIASELLGRIEMVAKRSNRLAVTLTCLQRLIPFYERNGFVNEGESESSHAGEVWYNMVKPI